MPIITDQGIFTEELCENSKKYLSRLLIGKTGINPDLLSWELLLTEKLRLDHFIETGNEDLTQLQEARTEWNLALKEVKLQSHIQNKLIEIETLHAEDYLKAYDPEVKKQQADLRSKQLAWVSITVIIGLTTAFAVPFTLGLLGTWAVLTSIICFVPAVSLTCCSIIPAFFGETLIDDEWIKEYGIEKEKCQLKLSALKKTSQIINQGIVEQNSHSSIIQQTPQIDLTKKLTTPSLISVATETTHFKSLKKDKTIHSQSSTISANKSCGLS